MILLVGLGNPDKKYYDTYHNLGFMVMNRLAEKQGVKFNRSECMANTIDFFVGSEKVILAKPLTYMNLSGNSLMSFKNKYKMKTSQMLVVCDDIDLPLGTYRYRESGSGGTHNGLRSIVHTIGSDFKRIRIGIGRPENMDLADYVLSKISKENMEILDKVIDDICDFIIQNIFR